MFPVHSPLRQEHENITLQNDSKQNNCLRLCRKKRQRRSQVRSDAILTRISLRPSLVYRTGTSRQDEIETQVLFINMGIIRLNNHPSCCNSNYFRYIIYYIPTFSNTFR